MPSTTASTVSKRLPLAGRAIAALRSRPFQLSSVSFRGAFAFSDVRCGVRFPALDGTPGSSRKGRKMLPIPLAGELFGLPGTVHHPDASDEAGQGLRVEVLDLIDRQKRPGRVSALSFCVCKFRVEDRNVSIKLFPTGSFQCFGFSATESIEEAEILARRVLAFMASFLAEHLPRPSFSATAATERQCTPLEKKPSRFWTPSGLEELELMSLSALHRGLSEAELAFSPDRLDVALRCSPPTQNPDQKRTRRDLLVLLDEEQREAHGKNGDGFDRTAAAVAAERRFELKQNVRNRAVIVKRRLSPLSPRGRGRLETRRGAAHAVAAKAPRGGSLVFHESGTIQLFGARQRPKDALEALVDLIAQFPDVVVSADNRGTEPAAALFPDQQNKRKRKRRQPRQKEQPARIVAEDEWLSSSTAGDAMLADLDSMLLPLGEEDSAIMGVFFDELERQLTSGSAPLQEHGAP